MGKDPGKYLRNCPKCSVEIFHKSKDARNQAIKNNATCRPCSKRKYEEYSRECPICKVEMNYKSGTQFYTARQRNVKCRPCANKLRSLEWRTGECCICKEEVVYKTLRSKTSAIKNKRPCDKCKDIEKERKHFRECHRCNNSIDYPDAKAYKRAVRINLGCNKCATKLRIRSGFVARNSSKGYDGWYLGHYFRSMLELKYINSLDKVGIQWESAENKEFYIEYFDDDGVEHLYFPDFFVDNNYLVEIKPEKHQNDKIVLIKKEAAEKWCLDRNYEYLIIDPGPIDTNLMIELYNAKKLVFTDKTLLKFLALVKRKNKEHLIQ